MWYIYVISFRIIFKFVFWKAKSDVVILNRVLQGKIRDLDIAMQRGTCTGVIVFVYGQNWPYAQLHFPFFNVGPGRSVTKILAGVTTIIIVEIWLWLKMYLLC